MIKSIKLICSENIKYGYSEQWEQLMSRDNKAQKSTYSDPKKVIQIDNTDNNIVVTEHIK